MKLSLWRRNGPASLAAASLVALAACSGSPDGTGNPNDPGDQTVERLRLGIFSEEGNLTPHTYQTGTPGLNLTMLTYDTLLQVDADGLPQPWLASDVEHTEDGLTYTLTLTEGVTWHDGETFDADDVVFSIGYYQEGPPGRFQNGLSTVEEAIAVDDYTVTLELSRPNPSFDLRTLADVPILPQHIWQDIDAPDTAPFNDSTNVGSGPYRLVDSQPGRSYTFDANPDYFRGAPKANELVAVWFADDAGAIAALRTGEIDALIRTVSPEQITSLTGQGLEVLQAPEYATTLLAYDTERAPFDDVAFRVALAQAVNIDILVSDVYLDAAVSGSPGWVHPDSPFAAGDPTPRYDPAAANRTLEAAGYVDSDGNGTRELAGEDLDLELLVYGNNALRLRIAELIAAQLGEVGVGVKVSAVEPQTLDDAVWPGFDVNLGRDYEMAIFGWSAPTQADIGQTAALVSSDTSIGNLNITGFADPAVDDLALALVTTLDQDERTQVAHDLQAHIAEQLPFLTLLYPNGAYAYQPAVFDDWVSITGQGPMNKLSFIPGAGLP